MSEQLVPSERQASPSRANEVHFNELPMELRALAALVVNMLARHTHAQRQAVLRFALENEKYIPVNQSSVFSGTEKTLEAWNKRV